jgi:hypothetical protein
MCRRGAMSWMRRNEIGPALLAPRVLHTRQALSRFARKASSRRTRPSASNASTTPFAKRLAGVSVRNLVRTTAQRQSGPGS